MKAYRFTRRLAVAAVCAISVLATPVFAQAQTREAALLQRVQVEPTDLGAILELVRLYEVERRYDDALRMLTRAMSVVHEKRAAAAATTQKSVVIESPRVPAMGAGAAAQEPPGGQAALTQVPVRVGGAVLEPRKIRDVKPVYPAAAQAAGVQGVVILEVIIDVDGSVRSAKILRSVPMLDQAAYDAVSQWRFTPTLLNGQPVPVVMTTTVSFSLGTLGR